MGGGAKRKETGKGDFSSGSTSNAELFDEACALLAADPASAVEIFEKLDRSDFAPAATELGVLYHNGEHFEVNHKHALRYFKKAAQLGDVNALSWLGYVYRTGSGVRQNDEQAIRYYEQAAAAGNDHALDALTGLYDEGQPVPLKYTRHLTGLLEQAGESFEAGDYAAAVEGYSQCAEAGHPLATEWIAYMHAEGFGTEKNLAEAFRHYKTAADLGQKSAELRIAEAYIRGDGVGQDIRRGLKMAQSLDETDDFPEASFFLSQLYYAGEYVTRDPVKSLAYLERSHQLEPSPETTYNLGMWHTNGIGTEPNKTLGYSYYHQASLMGYAPATEQLDQMESGLGPQFDLRLTGVQSEITSLIAQMNSTGIKRFSLLISGPAGAGKKAVARYLAEQLGIPAITRDILDIASDAGTTLEAIDSAFGQASTGKMLILEGLEHLLLTKNTKSYFSPVEAQKILTLILRHLKNFKYPFVLILTDEERPEASFAKNFLFNIQLGYLTRENVQLAFRQYFDREPPRELSQISNLCVKDFDRTYRKLFTTGQLESDEDIIRSLKECGGLAAESDDNFDIGLVQSTLDLSDMLEKLKRSPTHQFSLMLSGPPGTGKSKYLRFMAKQLGYDVIVKKASDIGGAHYFETEKKIAQMFKEAEQKRAFLIIDEVEVLLGERKDEQDTNRVSHTNEFLVCLESHKYPVGCTTNHLDKVDRAALRRFLFKTSFNYLEKPQIAAAYQMFFGRPAPQGVSEIGGLVPADFAAVKKKAAVFDVLADDNELISLLKFEAKTKSRSKIVHYSETPLPFDMAMINPSINLVQLEDMLLRPGAKKDFSLLIYGPPGTGKSQYVKHLAQRMGIEVIVRRYSDLIGMWRGEAEKNIAQAFQEAEERKAFLVIDEIDSLLSTRANAMQSWELAQVNEMLIAMENYRYPLAGTTNLIDNIDPAALRRFLFSFKMDFLKPDQIQYAFKKYFNIEVPKKFAGFERFTPALFANIKKKAVMLDLLQSEEKLLALIEEEISLHGYKEEKAPEAISTEAITIPELPQFTLPIAQHAAEVLSAAVAIKVKGGHGSGFFISEDGLILTNDHVTAGAKFATVLLSTGREISGEVIRTHTLRDVALIKVNESGFNALPLRLEEPNVGAELFAIGSPLDVIHHNTLSKGIVSGFRDHYKPGHKVIQADTMIHGGNSGGPATDANGNVLCVSVAALSKGDGVSLGINYFIPIRDALACLNVKIHGRPKTAPRAPDVQVRVDVQPTPSADGKLAALSAKCQHLSERPLMVLVCKALAVIGSVISLFQIGLF